MKKNLEVLSIIVKSTASGLAIIALILVIIATRGGDNVRKEINKILPPQIQFAVSTKKVNAEKVNATEIHAGDLVELKAPFNKIALVLNRKNNFLFVSFRDGENNRGPKLEYADVAISRVIKIIPRNTPGYKLYSKRFSSGQ